MVGLRTTLVCFPAKSFTLDLAQMKVALVEKLSGDVATWGAEVIG